MRCPLTIVAIPCVYMHLNAIVGAHNKTKLKKKENIVFETPRRRDAMLQGSTKYYPFLRHHCATLKYKIISIGDQLEIRFCSSLTFQTHLHNIIVIMYRRCGNVKFGKQLFYFILLYNIMYCTVKYPCQNF